MCKFYVTHTHIQNCSVVDFGLFPVACSFVFVVVVQVLAASLQIPFSRNFVASKKKDDLSCVALRMCSATANFVDCRLVQMVSSYPIPSLTPFSLSIIVMNHELSSSSSQRSSMLMKNFSFLRHQITIAIIIFVAVVWTQQTASQSI